MSIEQQLLGTHVNLMHSQRREIVAYHKLPALRCLVISHSKISSLQFLRHMPNLEELYADFCGLTSYDTLRMCPHLSLFVARGNAFSDSLCDLDCQSVDILGNQYTIEEYGNISHLEDLRGPIDCLAAFEVAFLGQYAEKKAIFYQHFNAGAFSLSFDDQSLRFSVGAGGGYEAHLHIYQAVEQTEIRLNYQWEGQLSLLHAFELPDELLYAPYAYKYEDEWCPQVRHLRQQRERRIEKHKWFVLMCVHVEDVAVCFVLDPRSRRLLDVEELRKRIANKQRPPEVALAIDEAKIDFVQPLNDEFEVQTLVCTRKMSVIKKPAVEPIKRDVVTAVSPPSSGEVMPPASSGFAYEDSLPLQISVAGSSMVSSSLVLNINQKFAQIRVLASALQRDQLLQKFKTFLVQNSIPHRDSEDIFEKALEQYNSGKHDVVFPFECVSLYIEGIEFELDVYDINEKDDHVIELVAEMQDRILCFLISTPQTWYSHIHTEFVSRAIEFSSVKLVEKENYISAQAYEISGVSIIKSSYANIEYTFFKNNLVIEEGAQPFCNVQEQNWRFKCECEALTSENYPIGEPVMSNQIHIKPQRPEDDKPAVHISIEGSAVRQPSPLSAATRSRESKLEKEFSIDDSMDEISETSTAPIAEMASSITSTQAAAPSGIRGSTSLFMINYAITESDSQYQNLQIVEKLYQPLSTRQKLIYLRNQFKENNEMRLDTLFASHDGIIEPETLWIKREFLEFSGLKLEQKPKYLSYHFAHEVEIQFAYSKYGEPLHHCVSLSTFSVARDVKGGWVFVLEDQEYHGIFALPICTKYQIVTFAEFTSEMGGEELHDSLKLEAQFIKSNSDSEKEQTFVLLIEGIAIPFNGSPGVSGALNQILSIAYNEVVGEFSKSSASNKKFNELAINRITSIAAYRNIAEKMFGLEAKTLKTVEEIMNEYLQQNGIIDREEILLSYILQIANCCTQTAVHDIADEVLEACNEGFEHEFPYLLLRYLFMYPVLHNYDLFRSIDLPDIKERFLTMQMKIGQKLIERPLPLELESLATLQLVKLPENAPPRDSVNIVLLRTDGMRLGTMGSFLGEYKRVAAENEFLIDHLSEDFEIFMQMLPNCINSEVLDMASLTRLIPKEFYQVLYFARRLCSENDDCNIDEVAVSQHIEEGGSSTVFFYILSKTEEALNYDYLEFLGQISEYYGEAVYDNLGQSMAFMKMEVANESGHAVLYKEHCSATGREICYVDRHTGFPRVFPLSSKNATSRNLQLLSGFAVKQEDMLSRCAAERCAVQLFNTENTLANNPEFETCDTTVTCLKILRIFSPERFEEFCDEAMSNSVFTVMSCHIEDENPYEVDENKSMSDEQNNVHPYRGKCDEMREDNDELSQAIAEFYDLKHPSLYPVANNLVFKAMVRSALGLSKLQVNLSWTDPFVDLVEEKRIYRYDLPMDCIDMQFLADQQSYCAVQQVSKAAAESDLAKWGKICRK